MTVTNVFMSRTQTKAKLSCVCTLNMLIVSSNDEIIKSTKKMLNSKFGMKDMGVADVILGIRISKIS